jgi:hypothetical protein
MDYFTNYDANKNYKKAYGLRDLIFRIGASPLKDLKCQLDLHNFTSQKKFISEVDGVKHATCLGWETDFTFDYQVQKGLKARLGYDMFFPTEDWQGRGADRATFIYLEITSTL